MLHCNKRFVLNRRGRKLEPSAREPMAAGALPCGPARPCKNPGMKPATDIRTAVDAIYRTESRRVLATLIRLLGDFDVAEEAVHEAFVAAVEQWPAEGIPGNPRAWLVSTGRFKAIDRLRRRAKHDVPLED